LDFREFKPLSVFCGSVALIGSVCHWSSCRLRRLGRRLGWPFCRSYVSLVFRPAAVDRWHL